MILLNSRQGHLTEALPGFTRKVLHLARHSFSRSYGVILPSSLTRVLPIALVYSTRLPVSDCGTDTWTLLEAFLGGMGSTTLAFLGARHHSLGSGSGFAYHHHFPTSLAPQSNKRLAYPSASPHRSSDPTWYRNIDLLSIAYDFRPRLRAD